jgi:cyclopropane fatty-acyl-phospholipid synthase-like methyltransferase
LKSFLNASRARLRKVVCPLDEVCQSVPECCSVFDLGCGTGAMLLELIRTRSVKTVGGCEVSREALAEAEMAVNRELGHSGEFIATKEPPLCLSAYDCITLIDVLHHIPKEVHEAYLRKVASLMKPGSILVLKDIDASGPLVWFNRLHDAIFAGNGFQEIPASKAEAMLKGAGLAIESRWNVRRLWYPHYFLIARKK